MNVIAKGDTKASVLLEGGIQSDLRVVSDAEYPFALMYFTGNKEHNIVMRQRAIERGLRLNEYGLFRSKEETRDPKLLVHCRTEEEIFQELGLHFHPARNARGHGRIRAGRERAAAAPHRVDGLERFAPQSFQLERRASNHRRNRQIHAQLGLSYWAITDHSKSSFQANGLDAARLRKQIKEVRAINKRLADEGSDFRLFTGAEVDVLARRQT